MALTGLSYNWCKGLSVSIEIKVPPTPLRVDSDGVVRVGETRVTLDSIVGAFSDGATAEQIVQQFPTLALADVYAAIAYYLRSPDDVESYLESRSRDASEIRTANERRFDPSGVRDRLLARRKKDN